MLESSPARFFGYLNTQKRLAAFTKLSTLSYKAESVKVHICTANDDDKTFVCAKEIILCDIALETR